MIDIAANIAHVRERVARAAERAGRLADSVRILAVSKTKAAALVSEAIRAGVDDVGENYVQEAAAKIPLVNEPARWHLIGHLQRNKVARALDLFEMIQTVDSVELADALDRRARLRGRVARVLIEVNIGGEPRKAGVSPGGLGDFVRALREYPNLRVEGLMTVPPLAPVAESARPWFSRMRRLREQLAPINPAMVELSMGMTDDFEVAVEEGATMVRIGRAIFGPREGDRND
jgi:PLP dependent protein